MENTSNNDDANIFDFPTHNPLNGQATVVPPGRKISFVLILIMAYIDIFILYPIDLHVCSILLIYRYGNVSVFTSSSSDSFQTFKR